MDKLAGIQTFVAVARALSFSAAARELCISRSVVSERIKRLELLIGHPLLVRSTRAVQLSPVGSAFLQECADLVEQADKLVEFMERGEGLPDSQRVSPRDYSVSTNEEVVMARVPLKREAT
jgi:DNA-binding transcriptional LysR family regulator